MKRFKSSPAYIDSLATGLYIGVGLLIALWFAVILRDIVNPYWLGISIATVFLYLGFMLWLMRQFTSTTRIFIIALFGVVSLGLLCSLVGFITGVRLPNDLPIVQYIHFFPVQTTTYDPGAVAVFYAFFAHIAATLITIPLLAIRNTKRVRASISKSPVAKVDLFIDVLLDKFSFHIDTASHSWITVFVASLLIVLAVVIGLGAILL